MAAVSSPVDPRLAWLAIGPVLALTSVSDGRCSCPKGSACSSPGKHPDARYALHGVKSATTDPRIVSVWPTSVDLGVAMGHQMADGRYAFAVDVDPRSNGDASFAALVQEHGPLPETVTNNSGGKGNHYVLAAPFPVASTKLADGIDVIGVGKYIKCAGSHHTGGVYVSALGLGPDDVPVADAPTWLLGALQKHETRTINAVDSGRRTFVGRAFELAGLVVDDHADLDDGRVLVKCPFASGHSDGRGHGHDTSTVLLSRIEGTTRGAVKCLHGSCASRKQDDFIKALPLWAVNQAGEEYPPPSLDVIDVVPEGAITISAEADFDRQLQECRSRLAYRPTKTGDKIDRTEDNVRVILSLDPRLGAFAFDDFHQTIYLTRPAPWDVELGAKEVPAGPARPWRDHDATELQMWFQRVWRLDIPRAACADVVAAVARRHSHNPVTDWLDSLRWDGVARLDTWLAMYLGAEDTPYTRSVGRKWLISAVARSYSPGAKVDTVLVLEGPQGKGKSTALRSLVPVDSWFADTPIPIGSKDAYVALRGKVIYELAELASLNRADLDKTKAFFSSPVDSYRPPYGREQENIPRRCIFAGTVNLGAYLHDATGARRFWPVAVGVIDLAGLVADRDQLWAEAVHRYQDWLARGAPQSECLWWPSSSEAHLFETEQAERHEQDVWADVVLDKVRGHSHVKSREIWELIVNDDRHQRMLAMDRLTEKRVRVILRAAGWQPAKGGERRWTPRSAA